MEQLADTNLLPSFRLFVNRLPISNDLKNIFSNIEIAKVKIERKSKAWHIFIKCEEIIPYADLSNLAQEIMNNISALQHVFFIPCFNPTQYNLKDFVNAYIDLLKLYIQYFLPSASGWIEETKWEVDEQNFSLFLPTQMLVDYFEQKNKRRHSSTQKEYLLPERERRKPHVHRKKL